MNYLCLICGFIAIIISIQLGRIQTQLYHIAHALNDIAKHTSKEYKL